ncbi:MAG: PEP-CTERM sorting domain-containing protein [Burkholderiales bacterium]|nr:PEP-CTERM sorting domain-containing protein [Burkholderiales bacterium]
MTMLGGISLGLLCNASQAIQTYRLTPAVTPSGASSITEISNTGYYAGTLSSGGFFHWSPTTGPSSFQMDQGVHRGDLGVLSLNDGGQVATVLFDGIRYSAVQWDAGIGFRALPGVAGWESHTEATGINNLGHVAGTSFNGEYPVTYLPSLYENNLRATLWSPGGVPTDLGVLPGQTWSGASDVNDVGQVIGASGNRAFIWSAGAGMRDLGVLPGMTDTELILPYFINDAGLVVGSIFDPDQVDVGGGGSIRSFAWTEGTGMRELNVTSAAGVQATGTQVGGLNENGVVIGLAWSGEISSENPPYQFLWTEAGGVEEGFTVDPVDLVEGRSILGVSAFAINDVGQVVATVMDPNNVGTGNAVYYQAILTPVGATSLFPTMPVSTIGGGFVFSFDTIEGQMVFVDPDVAIGYEYVVAGDQAFASVLLPDVGDGVYGLMLWNGTEWVDSGEALTAGTAFDFLSRIGPDGVTRFRITGIEVEAYLDPTDPTAFVTGLTFTRSGAVDMSQTPLIETVPVPEPQTWLLMFVGGTFVAGAVLRQRRRKAALAA